MTHRRPLFPASRRKAARGISLFEALVAMVVMSMGMLAFAGLHSQLRLNSDVARQRAEATRLAQVDLENFRAFSTLTQFDAVTANAATMTVRAADITTTENATYTIERAVATDGLVKTLRVTYRWNDRAGNQQNVVLRTAITGVDPKLVAALTLPPNGSPVKDLLGRDIQIPIPSKNLGNGTSVYKPTAGGGTAFIFNNDTGKVTSRCNSTTIASTTTANLSTSNLTSSVCTEIDGRIVSGYVRWSLSNQPDADNPNSGTPSGITVGVIMNLDDTTPPTGGVGTGRQLTATYWNTTPPPSSSLYPAPAECAGEDGLTVTYDQAINISQTNNGTTQTTTTTKGVVIVPATLLSTLTSGTDAQKVAAVTPYVGVGATISNIAVTNERFYAYTCVVQPIEMGVTGGKAFTGRTILSIAQGATSMIGTSGTTYKVCRYIGDYDATGTSRSWQPDIVPANSPSTTITSVNNYKHPYAYLASTTSLSNQNFLVIKGNSQCPNDGPPDIDGQGQDNYTDSTTVTHQP